MPCERDVPWLRECALIFSSVAIFAQEFLGGIVGLHSRSFGYLIHIADCCLRSMFFGDDAEYPFACLDEYLASRVEDP